MVAFILDFSLPYYINSVLALILIVSGEFFHQTFIVIWIFFVLLPILDQFLPLDHTNPTEEEEKILLSQSKWKYPIYSFAILDWICLFWCFSYILRFDPSTSTFIILVLSDGLISGMSFLFSHECLHKRDLSDRILSQFILLKSLYMHYYSEHSQGHHKLVSTPEDPASARYDQDLFSFYRQSYIGSFLGAWNREGNKMIKKKRGFYSWKNRMLQWIFVEVLTSLAIWWYLGNKCLVFFLVQALISTSLLESANYVRHYGLERKKLPNGEYEPVTTKHSWNAAQPIQNYMLLKVQRHSDHHENSYKPYQILNSSEDYPNLPCGYSVCIMASMIPMAWFSIINPLCVTTNQDGKPTKEQLEKSNRALRIWLFIQLFVVSGIWVMIV